MSLIFDPMYYKHMQQYGTWSNDLGYWISCKNKTYLCVDWLNQREISSLLYRHDYNSVVKQHGCIRGIMCYALCILHQPVDSLNKMSEQIPFHSLLKLDLLFLGPDKRLQHGLMAPRNIVKVNLPPSISIQYDMLRFVWYVFILGCSSSISYMLQMTIRICYEMQFIHHVMNMLYL